MQKHNPKDLIRRFLRCSFRKAWHGELKGGEKAIFHWKMMGNLNWDSVCFSAVASGIFSALKRPKTLMQISFAQKFNPTWWAKWLKKHETRARGQHAAIVEGSLLMKYFYAIIKKNYKNCASTKNQLEARLGMRSRQKTQLWCCRRRKEEKKLKLNDEGNKSDAGALRSFHHFSSSSFCLMHSSQAPHTLDTDCCHHQQNKSFLHEKLLRVQELFHFCCCRFFFCFPFFAWCVLAACIHTKAQSTLRKLRKVLVFLLSAEAKRVLCVWIPSPVPCALSFLLRSWCVGLLNILFTKRYSYIEIRILPRKALNFRMFVAPQNGEGRGVAGWWNERHYPFT